MHEFYIGATPIGGDLDITKRTLKIIEEADYILCENIEITKRLMGYGSWKTKEGVQFLEYCVDFGRSPDVKNHGTVVEGIHDIILNLVMQGNKFIYLPERGSVGIEDPGLELMKFLEDNNVKVINLPGPSSVIAALIAARPMEIETCYRGFIFQPLGDLPESRMEHFVKLYSQLPHPVIFMVHDHEIYNLLLMIKNHYGNSKKITIGMNLSLDEERVVRATVGEILESFSEKKYFKMYTLIVVDAANLPLPESL
jgi:16S rRNA (cytidine1402-2'-O)-methyltransferase